MNYEGEFKCIKTDEYLGTVEGKVYKLEPYRGISAESPIFTTIHGVKSKYASSEMDCAIPNNIVPQYFEL